MKTYILLHMFHVSVITGNILITIKKFARYHVLLASNSILMTDSMYLGTIQICRNLNQAVHSSFFFIFLMAPHFFSFLLEIFFFFFFFSFFEHNVTILYFAIKNTWSIF